MLRIKEVIIVEGKDDTAKLKQVLDVDTIETNGSAINKETLELIKHAQMKRGTIIFTDPDYPGQRIRHIISNAVPDAKHAFLTKDEARGKYDRGIGIEHAKPKVIKEALARVYQLETPSDRSISKIDLLDLGLIGDPSAKNRREKLTERLRIGYANGKQLLKRLQMFHITKDQLANEMDIIFQEERNE